MRKTVVILTVSGLAGGLFSLTTPDPVAAANVPADFVDSPVGSFSKPTAVEWLPGDEIVVLEQGGRVRVGDPAGRFRTALTISDICSNGERGLLGFTHDPAFLTNRFVYVYYTRDEPAAPGDCVNRVSRFTLNDTIDRASEVVLLDNISSVNTNHNGGDLDIGSDGFLYVAVGDAGRDPRGDSGSAGSNDAAQDLSLLNGKILRITLDGQPAPGNPLIGPGTARCATRGNTPDTPTTQCQEIFAWGLRNPYRIAFDRNDGADTFYINDVGQGTREEVNVGVAGGNYGWPTREGFCRQGLNPPCAPSTGGLTDPITDYGRSYGSYITAGAFVPDGLWPAAYDGSYLFGDGGSGNIWRIDARGAVDYDTPFATGAFGLTDMTFGFDAAGRMVLYYVQIGGSLRKVTPPPAPAAPTANQLRMIPVTPFRAYDTGDVDAVPVGTKRGDVHNGTTRRIDLDPPQLYAAAMVNITYANTRGAGFIRAWQGGASRPATSSLNADSPGTVGANVTIVPLDGTGSFVIESTLTSRLVVDVLAWFEPAAAATAAGRYIGLPPARLVDTRITAGTPLTSGSDNPYARSGVDITVDPTGRVGFPSDGTAAAVVLSVAALGNPSGGGWVSLFPSGGTWPGSSNVNVVANDVRANLVIVPLGADGKVTIRTLNVDDVVLDVLGYVTSASAQPSTSGLYSPRPQTRIVDTRDAVGFGRLLPEAVSTVTIPSAAGASVVVQNLTIVNNDGPGWVAAFPSVADPPFVSTLNYSAPNQIRAVLAFTTLPSSKTVGYRTMTPTDLVVDVVGTFTA
jgi:glucose/arabinose dehydrogenase